jgi:acetoin utilization deacetylase AcuC-like enzyme
MTIIYSYHPHLNVEGYEYPTLAKAKAIHDILSKREDVIPLLGEPVTKADLYKIHSPFYVDAVIGGETANGFGNKDRNITKQALAAAGCHVEAAKYAFKNKLNTFSLTSGAHHAKYDRGGGFCTFNALILAAIQSGATRTLILDGDAHLGDGCIDIIARRGLSDRISYYHVQTKDDIRKVDATGFDLILWNAGADAFHNDCGRVTQREWNYRDLAVKDIGLPVCTSIAGGYTTLEDVVRLHLETIALVE